GRVVAVPLPGHGARHHGARADADPRRDRRDLEPAASRRGARPPAPRARSDPPGEEGRVIATLAASTAVDEPVVPRPLVEIDRLVVDYVTRTRTTRAVDGVSLVIGAGEIVGLAGESGCGKSTLANALMQLIRPPAQISGGRILFQGEDLVGKTREDLRRFRWRNVSMVFQSAMNALNPVMRVGDQFVGMMQARRRISNREAARQA